MCHIYAIDCKFSMHFSFHLLCYQVCKTKLLKTRSLDRVFSLNWGMIECSTAPVFNTSRSKRCCALKSNAVTTKWTCNNSEITRIFSGFHTKPWQEWHIWALSLPQCGFTVIHQPASQPIINQTALVAPRAPKCWGSTINKSINTKENSFYF